ncbi:hypothetical protein B0J11DRAFT_578322 [Dendryphion nanum]|uniref:Uncharacterized protein n=1 Tax=Dendryphion nanum TaxID=256645 RepID=A0A9P9IRR3_9PLEO|nr:hypothetical protein B0J11DRAFT_578322 [Dendryphion nanum]
MTRHRTVSKTQHLSSCLQIGVDPENHAMILLNQLKKDGPWTPKLSVLVLAIEDNCLSVDFNSETPSYLQPLRSSILTLSISYVENLQSLTNEGIRDVLHDPLVVLGCLYSTTLVNSFAAQIELYRRLWSARYEPHALISAVYGYAHHRDTVRKLAARVNLHHKYIEHTLPALKNLANRRANTNAEPGPLLLVKYLMNDFIYFSSAITALNTDCNMFLEQQVNKLALQDARLSMQEARDLKRITFMAFVFVPLSFTPSLFGMNVRELANDSTPPWVFVVTALGILLGSLMVFKVVGSPQRTKRAYKTPMSALESYQSCKKNPADQQPTFPKTPNFPDFPPSSYSSPESAISPTFEKSSMLANPSICSTIATPKSMLAPRSPIFPNPPTSTTPQPQPKATQALLPSPRFQTTGTTSVPLDSVITSPPTPPGIPLEPDTPQDSVTPVSNPTRSGLSRWILFSSLITKSSKHREIPGIAGSYDVAHSYYSLR